MANVKSIKCKTVRLTLNDGRQRTLRFDLNAMAEMEERYGTIDKAFEEMQKGSIKGVRFILWAGLIHEDETLTEKQVGSLIDLDNLEEIMGHLSEAFEADMPEQTTPPTLKAVEADPN